MSRKKLDSSRGRELDFCAVWTSVVVTLSAAAPSWAQELLVKPDDQGRPVRVACVGDSITLGRGSSAGKNSYPAQLGRLLVELLPAAALKENTLYDGIHPDVEGSGVMARVAYRALTGTAYAGAQPKPIKVFILAGQSNMQGKAKVTLLEYQADQPATRDLFKHLKKDGKWIERDDVWIKYLNQKGKLTVGYDAPKCIGPELGFGLVVGGHYDEQVLLIKTAWGGRSLYRDFRSPSAGLPPAKVLERMLADLKKNNAKATPDDVKKTFGATYREMIAEVNTTLAQLRTHFQAFADQGYELAGFIWFQGWNDMINADATAEYAVNLKHFIHDVRKDLMAPKPPFVVGAMGVDGLNPSANVKKFKAAQAAALDEREFQGNVVLVKTDVFWDLEAAAVFNKGWRENLEAWNKVGSDYPYHYLGSPKTMLRIGQAFGEAILDLHGKTTVKGKSQ